MMTELHDEETPEYVAYFEDKDGVEKVGEEEGQAGIGNAAAYLGLGRRVAPSASVQRNEGQAGSEEAEARATLEQWMGLNRNDMLTLDADAHQHALAQIGDRVYELSQILKEHQPYVVGALTELKCLSLLKSSIQSVLRSFREEG